MVYYYKIDLKKGNFILSEHDADEHAVFLEYFDVEFLRRMVENRFINSTLECLDYLRGDLEVEGGIDVENYYSLSKVIVNRSFKTDFEIVKQRYYVHVLPQKKGYLNMSQAPTNEFYIDTKGETGEFKTKFTKKEIEVFKEMPSLKGINFDECLEEVEDDEW
ncbi:hypothetical protein SN811_01310 [Ligilactobacillus agilis]|uniref:Uncharacterized protein n=1 Tax=Ligilactobacillus agilis TaxID=1601 RepID=A0A6F9Y248_9LACO|nr:hypothetical protein [Ligilactobacillus agilis]GET11631.1 hypothetical protein SN811_01310 [Ligilactobacillus agilis]